jgi:Protein of unknown function (DUF2917)
MRRFVRHADTRAMHAFYALARRDSMPFDSPVIEPGRSVLPRRGMLVLDNAAGTLIAVEHGCLWLTLERDPRDFVLTRGMRFRIDRGGRTVVAAEEDSRLRLVRPRTLAQRLAARLRHAIARIARERSSRPDRRWIPYY